MSFDLTDIEQQKTCYNWRNLRPLWGKENIAKSDNYEPHDEAAWSYLMRELGYEGERFLRFEEENGASTLPIGLDSTAVPSQTRES